MKTIKFKPLSPNFKLPKYETEGAANFDLRFVTDSKLNGDVVPVILYQINTVATLYSPDKVILNPGDRALIPLGFSVEMPEDIKLEIYSRSGLTIKQGLIILNAPGQVDSDYRGCVCALVKNEGHVIIEINNNDRICQGAFVTVTKPKFEVSEELTETERGEGGFGHSGVN